MDSLATFERDFVFWEERQRNTQVVLEAYTQ